MKTRRWEHLRFTIGHLTTQIHQGPTQTLREEREES